VVLISSSAHLHQLWASLGKVGIGMGTENKKKKIKNNKGEDSKN